MVDNPYNTWGLQQDLLNSERPSSLLSDDFRIPFDNIPHYLVCNINALQFEQLSFSVNATPEGLSILSDFQIGEDLFFIGKVILDLEKGNVITLGDISPYYIDPQSQEKVYPFSDFDIIEPLFEVKNISCDSITIGAVDNSSENV